MAKQQDVKNIPSTLVVFGATGDLARKRIFPSLYKLYTNKLLPEKFKIIACARSQFTSSVFRKTLQQTINVKDDGYWEEFAKNIDYLPLDVAKDINLDKLRSDINLFEKEINACSQKIFYMAIAPNILKNAIENLSKNNLHLACADHNLNVKPRIIVEKPFGNSLDSARDINKALSVYFTEEQIYRIDHYLGKETVQNIFAFRFANEIFEPIWSNKHIDHVQITTAEHIGVEKRGEFYDKTGALRDIVQNHLIQLMTLIAMEEPDNFNAKSINDKKLEIIKSISKLSPSEVAASTVRAQYEGFTGEDKINPNSQTETYAMVKLQIESSRWKNVPFYLRTAKKMPGKVTSIIIQFKEKQHKIFENWQNQLVPNHITIQIQPNEGIGIRLSAKKPGPETALEPVDMEFCYRTSFDNPAPDAYERLLLDVILGDQSLFLSQEIIEESWRIIDPIAKVWQTGKPKLATYKTGTWGPKEADDLIKKDGREWLQPLLTICKI